MAKNTGNSAFRRIDVDAITDDAYKDEEEGEPSTPGLVPDESEITRLLSQNKAVDALKVALTNLPIKSRDPQLRARSVALVVRILTSLKISEIESTVSCLEKFDCELLMKYVYKGFENPQENSSAILLAWHDRLFDAAGNGCIERVLTDRRRL